MCVGKVYILESVKNARVKIGTTSNDPDDRKTFVQRLWRGDIGKCQICLERHPVLQSGLMPLHGRFSPHHRLQREEEFSHYRLVSGSCFGSLRPPIEIDASAAKLYLNDLKNIRDEKKGTERGSLTRRINNFEKKIEQSNAFNPIWDKWETRVIYHTDEGYKVEQLTHTELEHYKDNLAPIQEIFCCSVREASQAVERVLERLGILEQSRREFIEPNENMIEYNTPDKKSAVFECVMCKSQWVGLTFERNSCKKCNTHLFSRCLRYI